VLRWNRDAQVNLVWHPVPLHDLALLLFGQGMEDGAQLPARLAKMALLRRFGTNTT
jgi:hypothetical protein